MMIYTIPFIYFSGHVQYDSEEVKEGALFSGWVKLPAKKWP